MLEDKDTSPLSEWSEEEGSPIPTEIPESGKDAVAGGVKVQDDAQDDAAAAGGVKVQDADVVGYGRACARGIREVPKAMLRPPPRAARLQPRPPPFPPPAHLLCLGRGPYCP